MGPTSSGPCGVEMDFLQGSKVVIKLLFQVHEGCMGFKGIVSFCSEAVRVGEALAASINFFDRFESVGIQCPEATGRLLLHPGRKETLERSSWNTLLRNCFSLLLNRQAHKEPTSTRLPEGCESKWHIWRRSLCHACDPCHQNFKGTRPIIS